MPIVVVREEIGRDIDTVWELVAEVGAYSNFMESVEAVTVLEQDDGRVCSRWRVRLRGSVLTWVEEDRKDPAAYRIDYCQIDGDLSRFEGYWQLEPLSEERTAATLLVDFEIGIPLLEEMLNPVAASAIRENAVSMLRSFEDEAERSTPK